MKFTNMDIVLFAIDELQSDRSRKVYTNKVVAETLNISTNTLSIYISRLAKQGFLMRGRKHFPKSFLENIRITPKGRDHLKVINEGLKNVTFTPERHKISTCLNYNEIVTRSNNPLERIFLLHLYSKKHTFDLERYVSNLSTAKNDLNILNVIRKLGRQEDEPSHGSYVLDVFNMSLYGDLTDRIHDLKDRGQKEDIDMLLIHAETLFRQGKLEESEMVYRQLLTIKTKITQNQWFQCNLGLSLVIRRKDGPSKAIAFLERVERMTDETLYHSCILQSVGTCYGMMGEYQKAIEYFTLSIRSFRYYQYPLLMANALNNRGVTYFIGNDIGLAEKDWSSALKYARKAGSEYAEARLLSNLSDIEVKRGSFDRAKALLDRSERAFRKVDDFEGLALVEFNRTLLSLARKDINGFFEHFERSEHIAYPLPPRYERDFRRGVLLERAKESGMNVIEKFLCDMEKSKDIQ